jgi:hypothetical protein
MYSVTNFLILASQSSGKMSASLSTALIGSMCISLPPLLRAPYRLKNFIIILSFVLGGALLYDQIRISHLALLSGIIQAVTFATASNMMRVHKIPVSWNLFTGFLFATLLGCVITWAIPQVGSIHEVQLKPTLIMSVMILLSQLAFFKLYQLFSAEAASRYSLGRVPWSFLLEMALFRTLVPTHTLLGLAAVCFASFSRKERRSVARIRPQPEFQTL